MKMEDTRWLQLSIIIMIPTLFPNLVAGFDTITATQSLTKNQTIVSSGEVFELGFFSPGNSNKWYIGIWYKKIPTRTIVWVANRDNPLSSSSGTLKIDKNGKSLILADGSGKSIWQTNGTSSSASTVAQILDTGNFVVRREDDTEPGNYIWQSFYHPTDTLLPGMKLGLDKKTGLNRYLTSWKNIDDPSSGDFVFKINFNGFPEFFLWQNQIEVYRSGPWNGLRFSGVPEMGHKFYNMNFTFVMDKDEDTYSFQMNDPSKYSRLLVNSFGVLQRFVWIQTKQSWNVLWYAPSDQCDMYGECGAFGICDTVNSTLCQCMKGFEPKNVQEWNLRDGSEGCALKHKLNCRSDGFLPLKNVKLPKSSNAVFNESMSMAECRKTCLRNCSCTAYASMESGGSGCVIWLGDLVDLRQYSVLRGGQELFVRVPNKVSGSTLIGRIIDQIQVFLESWDLRMVILFSLLLQTLLIFLAPFRKRVSSLVLSFPMWLAYLLADITATYALGIISKAQTHDPRGPFANHNLPALWAPFLLVHLGGPDTITAFALEDNELWLRHALNLLFQGFAVTYAFVQSFSNKRLWLPTLLMIFAGLIKYTERTRSLFLASTRRFRNSLLKTPDPGPNYAKLMDEYSSKLRAKLPTKIEMIAEPKRDEKDAPEVKELSDLDIVKDAHDFFDTFKGLIADLIFSFRERTESRAYFLQRTARDAFKVVEVELNFFYEILYTKFMVVNNIYGYILRFVSISLTCASLVLFILFEKHNIERFDTVTTYTLLIGAIALDFIAFIMALSSDWTAVKVNKYPILLTYFGSILRVKRKRWPDDKPEPKVGEFMAAEKSGDRKLRKILHRRWSESISQHNLIHCCLNPRPKWWEKTINFVGLMNIADSIQYVNTKEIDDEIRYFIFGELKIKSEVADDLESSKEINSARGDWILRFLKQYKLLPWITDVDFDESLLLWHLATDLLYYCDEEDQPNKSSEDQPNKCSEDQPNKSSEDQPSKSSEDQPSKSSEDQPNKSSEDQPSKSSEDQANKSSEDQPSKSSEDQPNKSSEENSNKKKKVNYRRVSKLLSDYMLYLLMMQSTMMSTVAGIGEIRFRDTCAEAKIFFVGRGIKKEKGRKCPCCNCFGICFGMKKEEQEKKKQDERHKLHKQACEKLLGVHTVVKPVTVKGDRSKSVLFDACMLAKELKEELKGKTWKIMSKVWVELLCYAASRCRASRHVAQLSKGSELLTIVWLLMTHLGLGSQFQISEGHARAKLIVGK